MKAYSRSHRSVEIKSSLKKIHIILIVPLVLILFIALGLAADATVENIRVAKATSQLFDLVTVARNYAAAQTAFAQQPGEDLFATLQRAGQIVAETQGKVAKVYNPWGGAIESIVVEPSIIRIETSIPARNCRRLGVLFSRSLKDLGVKSIEARGPSTAWVGFFKETDASSTPMAEVDRACGNGDLAVLAISFHLR